jgi:signal transduction histidine kinase
VIKFILRNLVSNAIKFTEKGAITISSEKKNGKIRIIVSDTGVGMSPEKADRLFKASPTSSLGTKNEKGSGLGIMLVKEFIDQLNGNIKVESKLGEGTRFIISI